MNKFKQLTKRIGIEAGVIFGILVVCFGIYTLTGSMVSSAEQAKTEAESALSQDRGQLANLRAQLDRSGEAERRFIDIQLKRTTMDFSSSTDTIKSWASNAKARYRLANNFRLSLPPEQPSDKPELSGLDYNITLRPGVTMELEAMSDTHVFSLVDDLQRSLPGLVRIKYVDVERKGELDGQSVAQMVGGMAPSLVASKIQFDWIGINPKEASANAAPAAGGMPGGAPEVMP